ncbi:MAG: DUF3536 domain-containing protein [Prochlorotrichaceae cyanobacterium]
MPPTRLATATVATPESLPRQSQASRGALQSRATRTGIYVAIHGHFYQPPRENPYLESVERQAGAAPFHDWNERIYWECYRPNAFARVLAESGKVLAIVNNFEYLSFNVGPTLLNWLERYDSKVYEQILEGDRRSVERCNGHGNAIAQAYNHVILPLANERDKQTQIRWGIADFRQRFQRDPEGLWLPETAVDQETLRILVQEGIRFVILSPSQAQRCRPLPTPSYPRPEWLAVGGGQIDPTRPYRCFLDPAAPVDPAMPREMPEFQAESLNNGQNQPLPDQRSFIDIFFFDGPISRDLGFGDLLGSSQQLADRINLAIKGDHRPAQIIGLATDGETFGHHKIGGEKCLAYAFLHTFPERNWIITNYAHYLSENPPLWEVELKPVTAWSCSHGVDRWQADCGCGRSEGTHQRWRKPLRQSLDWLRDELVEIFEQEGERLFRDPWKARDDYITVLTNGEIPHRHPSIVETFLQQHQHQDMKPEDQVDALRLLEMQRHALLMYTSCGWFFDELSRPEGVQILCYAARALKLAGEVTGKSLEADFIEHLATIPSNVDSLNNGAMVYQRLVERDFISPEHVAAHYAISSLFSDRVGIAMPDPPVPSLSALVSADLLPTLQQQRLYCYTVYTEDHQLQRLGSLTLGVGQIRLVSDLTWETVHLVFAVLHLGAWDFHCCIQPFAGRLAYAELKRSLFEVLEEGSAAQSILVMNQLFRDAVTFSLQDLFTEERHRLMHHLTEDVINNLNQLYTQVYRVNYGVLMAFRRDGLPVPHELQVAAEVALSHRLLHILRKLDHSLVDLALKVPLNGQPLLRDLEELVPEVEQLHCQLNLPEARNILERLMDRVLWQLLQETNAGVAAGHFQYLSRLVAVGKRLDLGISLARAQEIFYAYVAQLMTSKQPLPTWAVIRNYLAKLSQLLWVALPPGLE